MNSEMAPRDNLWGTMNRTSLTELANAIYGCIGGGVFLVILVVTIICTCTSRAKKKQTKHKVAICCQSYEQNSERSTGINGNVKENGNLGSDTAKFDATQLSTGPRLDASTSLSNVDNEEAGISNTDKEISEEMDQTENTSRNADNDAMNDVTCQA